MRHSRKSSNNWQFLYFFFFWCLLFIIPLFCLFFYLSFNFPSLTALPGYAVLSPDQEITPGACKRDTGTVHKTSAQKPDKNRVCLSRYQWKEMIIIIVPVVAPLHRQNGSEWTLLLQLPKKILPDNPIVKNYSTFLYSALKTTLLANILRTSVGNARVVMVTGQINTSKCWHLLF